jgi:GNAT superfamily N-acetyltransferase
MLALSIRPLEPNSPFLAQIATGQFEYWGPLTGYGARNLYELFLQQAALSADLPRVLFATRRGSLLGSVNLLASDMTIRPQLTPWIGQLFVTEGERSRGVGTALVDAAISYIERLGYRQLFLFTSGSLPHFYRKRRWSEVESVAYLGKVRTIMRFDITSPP